MKRVEAFFGVLFVGVMGGYIHSAQAQSTPLKGYVMDIQMVPAVCALDKQKNKKRKCVEGYSLNIAGLYPETNQSNCVTSSSASLSPLQAKVMSRVMPDIAAREQLWANYGGCVPVNASQYFRAIINLADRLNVPLELSASENKTVSIAQLRNQFIKLNKGMPSQALHLSCRALGKEYVLTGVSICYSTTSKYKQCPKYVTTNCPNTFLIKGSF